MKPQTTGLRRVESLRCTRVTIIVLSLESIPSFCVVVEYSEETNNKNQIKTIEKLLILLHVLYHPCHWWHQPATESRKLQHFTQLPIPFTFHSGCVTPFYKGKEEETKGHWSYMKRVVVLVINLSWAPLFLVLVFIVG